MAGGINLYAYVGGDPVNWLDPKGLIHIGNVENNISDPFPSEWPKANIPPGRPIKGPFGTLCGPEGKTLATWIPDIVPGCKDHDDCYDKCAKNCEGIICKWNCDFKLMWKSAIYGTATLLMGDDAYRDAKEKYGCYECTE